MFEGIATGAIIFGIVTIVIYIGLIVAIFEISANAKKITQQLDEMKKQNKELYRMLDINNSLVARLINETAKDGKRPDE